MAMPASAATRRSCTRCAEGRSVRLLAQRERRDLQPVVADGRARTRTAARRAAPGSPRCRGRCAVRPGASSAVRRFKSPAATPAHATIVARWSYRRFCFAAGRLQEPRSNPRRFCPECLLGHISCVTCSGVCGCPSPRPPLPAKSGERVFAAAPRLEAHGEIVEQGEQLGDLHAVAGDLDEALAERLGQRQLAQDDAVEGGAVERDGAVGASARAGRPDRSARSSAG